MVCRGTAPTIWSTTLPSLKKSSMGMERTLKRVAVLMFASTSSLVTFTFPFYRDLLGLPEVPLDTPAGARLAGLHAGESLVEHLEADTPDTPIGKFVAKQGPGIHRVCFAVDDIDATIARCQAAGVRLI